MELDEMKATWESLSTRLGKQEKLTSEMIEKMIRQNFRSRLNKILLFEYAGIIICYIGAAWLIANFQRITSLMPQVLCIATILLLFALPVLSLKSVKGLKSIDISTRGYSDVIRDYIKQKIRFQRFQQWNVVLGLLLLLTFIPVISSIMGKDITAAPVFWTLIFPINIAIYAGISFWTLRHYNRMLDQAQNELAEIDN